MDTQHSAKRKEDVRRNGTGVSYPKMPTYRSTTPKQKAWTGVELVAAHQQLSDVVSQLQERMETLQVAQAHSTQETGDSGITAVETGSTQDFSVLTKELKRLERLICELQETTERAGDVLTGNEKHQGTLRSEPLASRRRGTSPLPSFSPVHISDKKEASEKSPQERLKEAQTNKARKDRLQKKIGAKNKELTKLKNKQQTSEKAVATALAELSQLQSNIKEAQEAVTAHELKDPKKGPEDWQTRAYQCELKKLQNAKSQYTDNLQSKKDAHTKAKQAFSRISENVSSLNSDIARLVTDASEIPVPNELELQRLKQEVSQAEMLQLHRNQEPWNALYRNFLPFLATCYALYITYNLISSNYAADSKTTGSIYQQVIDLLHANRNELAKQLDMGWTALGDTPGEKMFNLLLTIPVYLLGSAINHTQLGRAATSATLHGVNTVMKTPEVVATAAANGLGCVFSRCTGANTEEHEDSSNLTNRNGR